MTGCNQAISTCIGFSQLLSPVPFIKLTIISGATSHEDTAALLRRVDTVD